MSRTKTSMTFVVSLLVGWALIGAACGDKVSPAADTITAPSDADGSCVAGSLGCACGTDDACARGQCVAGVCALCTLGDDGCLCRSDGSCKGALLCREGQCETCPAGAVGCACLAGGCDEGGECTDGTCGAVGCPPGSVDCACRRTTTPPCDETLTCLGDGNCRACAADRPGCDCDTEGACAGGLLCDGTTCRAPRSCADLVADGFCGDNEVCTESVGVDAECTPGECQPGFVFDRGRCIAGRPNCLSDAPGSVLNACTSRLRLCVDDGTTATCGACIDDALEVGGECVGRLSCGAGSCLNSEYCDTTGPTPSCQPLPCAAGQATDAAGCRPCGFTCAGEGLSGRVWPFRTNTSTCVCETVQGYFMPPGGDTRPEICDIDGDGWVREEVRDPALTSDPALTANARCDLIEVTSVILRDELGIDAEVVSCDEGLIMNPGPTECFDRLPMPLIESLRNDTPGPLTAITTPAYGGRRLESSEVNSLTKACVSALGDFNDNGVEDLLEVQTPPARLGTDVRKRLQSFAYFIETHRAYVERDSARVRRLVIEERFRCDPNDFPLRYAPGVAAGPNPSDRYQSGDGATYWRSCTRGADPAFDPDADPPVPGYDFAQWSCPDGGNGCSSIAPGPPHGTLDIRQPITFGSPFPEDATLCELGSRFPADRVWRGMHHSSQFKCVGIGEGPGRKPLAAFASNGDLVMNLCEATPCPPGDTSCADKRPVVPGSASMDPLLNCRAVATVDASDVGFAAVRYKPYGVGYGGNYSGGCISEDTEYQDTLCPSPVFTVNPEADAFGANTCYIAPCPFGRADCDGDPLNGCERDATNNVDCGGCGVACAPARGVGDCSTGRCQVVSCDAGLDDCDNDAANGCETNIREVDNCGGCGIECTVEGGEPTCASGFCEVDTCDGLLADCTAAPGCETPINTNANCAGCGIPCQLANATAPTCTTGTCRINKSCAPDYDDCDENDATGCEASLNSLSHCGACNNSCDLAHASDKCVGGSCLIDQCSSGFGNCDGNQANGCELALTSTTHCGRCNNVCELAGASPRCSNGQCVISSCNTGRANCDNNDTNGCEVSLDNNPSCGTAADLGSFNADSTCGAFCAVQTGYVIDASRTGRGEAWFKIRLNDNIGICSGNLQHRIKLNVPNGVDYDLHAYSACGGTLLASASRGTGLDETMIVLKDDTSTDDGSINYWVFVQFHTGRSCSEWSLSVEGTRCGE